MELMMEGRVLCQSASFCEVGGSFFFSFCSKSLCGPAGSEKKKGSEIGGSWKEAKDLAMRVAVKFPKLEGDFGEQRRRPLHRLSRRHRSWTWRLSVIFLRVFCMSPKSPSAPSRKCADVPQEPPTNRRRNKQVDGNESAPSAVTDNGQEGERGISRGNESWNGERK